MKINSIKTHFAYRIKFFGLIKMLKKIEKNEKLLEVEGAQHLPYSRILTYELNRKAIEFIKCYGEDRVIPKKAHQFEWAKKEMAKYSNREEWRTQDHSELLFVIKHMFNCLEYKPYQLATWIVTEDGYLIFLGAIAFSLVAASGWYKMFLE